MENWRKEVKTEERKREREREKNEINASYDRKHCPEIKKSFITYGVDNTPNKSYSDRRQ
jgi:hypothetical protein